MTVVTDESIQIEAATGTTGTSGGSGPTVVRLGRHPDRQSPRFSALEVRDILSLKATDLDRWIAPEVSQAPDTEGISGAEAESAGAAPRYSDNDVELLRSAKALRRDKVPARRIRAALASLRRRLPASRSPTALALAARGRSVVVKDGGGVWEAESGQLLFGFAHEPFVLEDSSGVIEPAAEREACGASVLRFQDRRRGRLDAQGWTDRARELESSKRPGVIEAYERALELEPELLDAHIDLGRFLHEQGDLHGARARYQEALDVDPDSVTARFNLAVVAEDLGETDEALVAYTKTLALDPGYADAYYNLARLYEAQGDRTSALRCLQSYRRIRGR